jgi:hypothetical protein
MQEAAADAAAKYWMQREAYRNALLMTESIADNHTKEFTQAALIAYVRARFRDISSELTKRIGCRLTCLPDGCKERSEVEHAVPLNLIHDRILGVKGRLGNVDHETRDILPTVKSIQAYVAAFMVGVQVTSTQHRQLKGHSMHDEWKWLADMPPWDWDELTLADWNYVRRPKWLQKIMGRYEHVPLAYRPTTDEERWEKRKKQQP